jgi:Fe-S-cluster containining protein
MNIDQWFAQVRSKYADQMQCGKGCTACCHGLFDISLADAAQVAEGFRELPPDVQERVHSKAVAIHSVILEATRDSTQPALFDEDDLLIDHIVEAANNPPCPCLGQAGECLIYEHRPLACRLEGVPMVDVHDGLFGDWCELNFKDGIPEAALNDLRQDYNIIHASDESRSAAVAQHAGVSNARAVTFIPSVIAEYQAYWKPLAILSSGSRSAP